MQSFWYVSHQDLDLNAGTNVISASQLAKADAVAFTLAPGRYLKEAPALPNGATGTLEGTAPNISYEVPVAGDQAAERVPVGGARPIRIQPEGK